MAHIYNRMALSRKTPLQRTGTLKKGKPLSKGTGRLTRGSKLKSRPKTPEEIQQNKEDTMRMWALFEEHWQKKPHRCEQCGEGIWGENKSLYHHHLLPKGLDRYEHLKYEYSNLMMLCWQCHSNVDSNPGDKVIERTEQAHKQFGV